MISGGSFTVITLHGACRNTFWATLPPTTVFRSVSELPPGHNLTVQNGEIRSRAYWRLDYPRAARFASADQCADALQELLADATLLRLRADVPVGAYLSGGLDSSITAALARQVSDTHLRTFSVTFDDGDGGMDAQWTLQDNMDVNGSVWITDGSIYAWAGRWPSRRDNGSS